MRWGILATGAIAERVAASARDAEGVALAAVASRDPARAAAFAARHGIPRSHGSYAALLADPAVDAVYVATPNDSHVALTLAALRQGKHVLVEKPFTRRLAEAREAAAAAAAARRVVSEAFMWRHHPQTERLVALVRSGAVGRVLMVRAVFAFDLVAARGEADTRLDPAHDGGSLMDVGCYCIDAIRLLAGEPERVHAESVTGPSGVDVAVACTMRMPGDVLGQFECGFATPHRDELEVVGTAGSLFLDDPWHCRATRITVRDAAGHVETVPVPVADPYRLQLEDVGRAIREGTPPRVGADDLVGQARAVEAVHRAMEEGASVVPAPPSPPAV